MAAAATGSNRVGERGAYPLPEKGNEVFDQVRTEAFGRSTDDR